MILAALHFVSAIVLCDDETLPDLIRQMQPDFLAMTTDGEDQPGTELVQQQGGIVITMDRADGYSTADITDRIKAG
jgi:bifunctional ADP-heptose synthase (sugar kinase/adenylyltransferase)